MQNFHSKCRYYPGMILAAQMSRIREMIPKNFDRIEINLYYINSYIYT